MEVSGVVSGGGMTVTSAAIVQNVVKDIRSFLQSNLTDPKSGTRTSSKWVLLNRPDYPVEYPTIVIDHIGGSDSWGSIGTEYKQVNLRVGIEVWTNSTSQRDLVWDDVYDELRTHFTTADTGGRSITGYGISDMIMLNCFNVDQPEEKMHRKVSSWSVKYYATT